MGSLKRIKELSQLTVDEDYVGAVIQQDYETMLIATVDYRQLLVGGVPQHGFLTVAVPDEDKNTTEVILLSVVGPEPMLTKRELVQVREELAERQVVDSVEVTLDAQTETQLSTQALRCKIIGSFYEDENGRICFGADRDNIRNAAVLRVYRPRGIALSLIASFSNSSSSEGALLEIGKVRYTETRKVVDQEAAVFVNVEDFIGAKTALFGMTRSGKSNSMKTLLQKVHVYSHTKGEPVAQLIFDPQGEYAQTNSQDGSALADIGDESEVAIYKLMERRSSPKEKFLQFNLFAEDNLELTYELFLSELRNGISGETNYVARLYNVDFAPLGEQATTQARVHWNRKKLGFFALAFEGLKDHSIKPFSINVGEDILVQAKEKGLRPSNYAPNELMISSTAEANRVVKLLLQAKTDNNLNESWKREFEEEDGGVFFEQLEQIYEKGRNGVKASLARLQPLHSEDAEGDVRENVWKDIQAGKLIVVDLSRGNSDTSQALSELIVNYLLNKASERFVGGLQPIPFQIVVEEAHNLFERDSKRADNDPWVRISKEAAKYRIGLVYATQEVSSVDRRILSNTHNWIISALNSTRELSELANYYQFGDWINHIKKIETRGFARFKTQSSPYIIPVQIEKFQAQLDETPLPLEEKKTAEPVSEDTFEELEF